ncbi:MAG TPA: glutamate-1-semialdehyde 2,1-aminomutase [Candidatus Tectomicrobia bacterium]|nr:glutamate-1-semialdehyde 2,1-aminomutase [Candidatus Tectomicrobia bacterium]
MTPAPAPRPRGFARSRALGPRFHRAIPGGSHTYAKGDDQYPEGLAPYIVRGRGCRVWDVDGNELIEYGMGLRAVTLGHAYPPVVEAAARRMWEGANFTRPALIELECAERLQALIPGADMVKFAKNGSDVTTAAVKLARAWTGRDIVAICAEHPFYSVDDWFIGVTPMAAGVPKSVRELTVTFHYNDLDSVRALFETHPGRIACVVLEPATWMEPAPGFLEGLRRLCDAEGALLVFDEMITGFRWHLRGARAVYGVEPDLAAYGKALGNGFAVSALAGRREVMELGGLHHDRERVFLLSTTHGAETHALAAAMEVMRIYEEEGVVETLYRQGERLAAGVRRAIAAHRLERHVEVLGRPCNLIYAARDQDGRPSQAFRTLLLQETLARGIIMPSLVVSRAHEDADIDATVERIDEALAVYRRALEDGVERHLRGRPVRPVMRQFN